MNDNAKLRDLHCKALEIIKAEGTSGAQLHTYIPTLQRRLKINYETAASIIKQIKTEKMEIQNGA